MKIYLILLATLISFPEERFTPKLILGASGNQHRANFENLPGQPGTDGAFDPELAFGYEIGFGLEYKFQEKVFGIFSSYSPELLFKNYSGNFAKQILAGNIIKENDYNQAYYNFDLQTNLTYFFISNYLSSEFGKVDFFIGPDIGFILGSNFNQREDLIADPGYTFEDGTTSLNGAEGDIQNINSLYIGANVGASYLAYSNKLFDFKPYLNLRFGFTSVLQDESWSPNSLNLGIRVNYKSQKENVKTPPSPIINNPPLPDKPIVAKWEIENNLLYENKKLKDLDSIRVPIQKLSYIDKYKLPSILYYEPAGIKPIESELDNTLSKQLDLLDGVAKSAGSNSIIINFFSAEKDLIEKRAEFLEEQLIQRGFKKDQLIRVDSIISYKRKYKELDEENEKVEFIIEGSQLVSVDYKKVDRLRNEKEINITLSYESNKKIKRSKYELNSDNVQINSIPINISLNPQEVLRKLNEGLEIKSKYVNEDNKDTTFINKIDLIPEYQIDTVLNQIKDDTKQVSQFILAYFDFDSSEFKNIDYEVLDLIKKALEENKKVEVYPLTDNLGANEYNRSLAKKRGRSAIKLINNKKIDVIYLDKAFFDNDHPFGRTLNRSVLVRIEN